MYGYSKSTNPGSNKNVKGDTFTLDFNSNNYTIKDFKNYEEPDKIQISLKDSTIIYPDPNIDIGNEPALEIIEPGVFTDGKNIKVRIEGFTRSEIRSWVEVATGRYRETEEGEKLEEPEWRKKQEKNPIQIK